MARTRGYCFTINNPDDDDYQQVELLKDIAKYLIVGKEFGEENTLHLQGYVYFSDAKTFKSVKKILTRAHIESTKGTPSDNRRYCSKDGDILIECGEIPHQGSRTDIDQVRNSLSDGANLRSIIATARSVQSIKIAEMWLKHNEPERVFKPEIRWYYGSTGVGKTRTAREWLGDDIYTCLDNYKFWEGYDGHENVIIDDIRGDFCKFHQLLKLLDRYAYKVETKGGSRQLLAKKIAITAPFPPEDLYPTKENVQQLIRRIDMVIDMDSPVIVKDKDDNERYNDDKGIELSELD
jgi:hypothetical protein